MPIHHFVLVFLILTDLFAVVVWSMYETFYILIECLFAVPSDRPVLYYASVEQWMAFPFNACLVAFTFGNMLTEGVGVFGALPTAILLLTTRRWVSSSDDKLGV